MTNRIESAGNSVATKRPRSAWAKLFSVASFSVWGALVTSAHGQPVVVTTPTSIGAADTSIAGVPLATAQITVRGTTLTVDGYHVVSSLILERNAANQSAVLTHSAGFIQADSNPPLHGAWILVANDLVVQGADAGLVGSRIDVSGRGYGPNQGIDATYGPGFLSWDHPSTLGAGRGSIGGGCIRLGVAGVCRVDGEITSNGASSGAYGQGGSGGSIWIEAGTLTGTGAINAIGGNVDAYGTGGPGGTIALWSDTSTFTGSVSARGGIPGFNGSHGAAGCVYMHDLTANHATARFDQTGGSAGLTTTIAGRCEFDADVTMRGGASVGPPTGSADTHFLVAGSLTVESGSGFTASGRGYAPGTGPGRGGSFPGFISIGAGHGGFGAGAANGYGGTYGSANFPAAMGSGGNNYGGGVLHIAVSGMFDLRGFVVANGDGAGAFGSGSAGGSVLIQAGSATGSGYVRARGGSTDVYGLGGGGGRIAAYACQSGGGISLSVIGGNGAGNGSIVTGTWQPILGVQPQHTSSCLAGTASLSVASAGTVAFAYQWQYADPSVPGAGTWLDLEESPRVHGARTATVTISGVAAADATLYRCIASTPCGSTTSDPAELTIRQGTIECARVAGVGQNVTLRNVRVSCPVDVINNSTLASLTLEDATGAITVFGANAVIQSVLAAAAGPGGNGNVLDSVAGLTGSYNGLFELFDASSPVSANRYEAPTVTVVTAADFADESPTAEGLESRLVRVENVVFTQTGQFASGQTLEAGGIRMWIATSDLAGQFNTALGGIPTGVPVRVTGIFEQFDSTAPHTSGYQIYPVLIERMCSCPSRADVAGLGGATGCDGQMTVDDLVYYLAQFFGGNAAVADISGLGGSPTPDGAITVDDLVAFLGAFFGGCP